MAVGKGMDIGMHVDVHGEPIIIVHFNVLHRLMH
jgi:hypothetical protein